MALRPPHTAEQIDLLPSPPPPSSPSSLSSDSQRFIPTPFLIKTYQLVDDVSIDSIVSWSDDGKAFVVWKPAEFALDVLPKHFKHNNFSSFVRQLNTYGFRKIMPDRWEFSHDCFRKGNKQLLCEIVRRKPAPASTSTSAAGATALNVGVATIPAALMDPPTSNSGEGLVYSWNSTPSSAAAPFTPSVPITALQFVDNSTENSSSSSSRAHLIDENDQLKKRNTKLCKELSHMKSMCTNIFSMMSNYNPGSGLGNGPGPPPMLIGCGSHNSSQAESMMIPLHLMPIPELPAAVVETQAGKAEAVPEHLSLNPSLSRFQYGSKRARGENVSIGEPVEEDDLLQLQQPGSSLSR